jgi:hypothetical protein
MWRILFFAHFIEENVSSILEKWVSGFSWLVSFLLRGQRIFLVGKLSFKRIA